MTSFDAQYISLHELLLIRSYLNQIKIFFFNRFQTVLRGYAGGVSPVSTRSFKCCYSIALDLHTLQNYVSHVDHVMSCKLHKLSTFPPTTCRTVFK